MDGITLVSSIFSFLRYLAHIILTKLLRIYCRKPRVVHLENNSISFSLRTLVVKKKKSTKSF
jgi:hypothetical protein